ncbi:MAG: AsnC family transcriptional regulator, partial [Pseudomonadales bacterium]|nr:AsnC family transcriptional regulator [Pseudomonadales bacterium]
MSLDATDRRILAALQRKGRMSNAELSETVHLS